jgi:hypothetical protein
MIGDFPKERSTNPALLLLEFAAARDGVAI